MSISVSRQTSKALPGVRRLIVTGPSRSGTTVLAALLSRLGLRFGLQDQAWNVDSGYYEHPLLLRAYGHVRKQKRIGLISDNIAEFFCRRAICCLREVLVDVDALKYPPFSSELPELVRRAGYAPQLAVSVRRFDAYALSRIRKEGVDWLTCKRDYMNIYSTSLFHLRLYGGFVFAYEDLHPDHRHRWIKPLMMATGAKPSAVQDAMQACVLEARSASCPDLADSECDALYERLLSCR